MTISDVTNVEAARMTSRFVASVATDARKGPAMNVPTLPASIDWSTVNTFLTGLGIDTDNVCADTPVTIGYDSIECQVFALNGDGNPFLDPTGNDAARHTISIPVVRSAVTSAA